MKAASFEIRSGGLRRRLAKGYELKPDEDLCLCFHVTRRKVENFLRVERPVAAAQLSDCFGAGTGCGWCRPLLKKLFEAHRTRCEAELPDAAQHAEGRGEHLRAGKGTAPPGASA